MGKIAFVFAGQGAQAPGMGLAFCNESPAAKAVFEAADAVREGTSAQCFESSEAELQITKNTQPCLYTVEMAIAAAVAESGIKADVTAGFSLGELSALTYAKVVSLENGLKMVKSRGELMQIAAEKHDTSMAAVLKLSTEDVVRICSQYNHVYPVNFNCPGQISVSGDAQEMLAFADAVKDAGGRAKFLKVNGAFHSPYMSEAARGFAEVIASIPFSEPDIPVYSNYTGTVYPEDMKKILAAQIHNPVKWETIIGNMITEGVDTFIELGPGKTLCGLIKRISSDVRLFNIAVPEDLIKLKAEL